MSGVWGKGRGTKRLGDQGTKVIDALDLIELLLALGTSCPCVQGLGAGRYANQ